MESADEIAEISSEVDLSQWGFMDKIPALSMGGHLGPPNGRAELEGGVFYCVLTSPNGPLFCKSLKIFEESIIQNDKTQIAFFMPGRDVTVKTTNNNNNSAPSD